MSETGPDHGPIEPEYRDVLNGLAFGLDKILNGEDCLPENRKVGFFLTFFNFGDAGRFNYISNADALDVLAMLKDVVARIEGRRSPPGRA